MRRTNNICNYRWLCIILLFFYACRIDQSNHIPRNIQPYVEEFVDQARQREISIDIHSLIIVFTDSLKDEEGYPVNAQYIHTYFPLIQHRIELDTTQYWWYHPMTREKVIFHELGHCLLKRAHRFDSLPGGLPSSIMGVTKTLTYELTPLYRKYYLDELFDPETPSPCWSEKFGCVDE